MAVILTSPVEGLEVGDTYEGPNEKFHLEQGYARKATKSKAAAPVTTTTGYKYDEADNPLNGDPTPSGTASLPPAAPETHPHSKNPPKVPEVPTNLKLNGSPDADLPPVAPETLLGQEGRALHASDITSDYEFPEDEQGDDDVEPTPEELAAIEAGKVSEDDDES